ncbi:MAG TPA: GAF domain-containing protein [Pyrinomonadaceae bacterium]|nr:GAF domain-containing protein [Pyrinomonadaceae bacterium]
MSEELENSLQQAIESYLGKRLAAIDEQLSRLQNDFGEALKGLRESSAGESLDASPLSAAIFAHLQAARAQKLTGAAPDRVEASGEIAKVKRAVEEIERQQKHADILGALLTAAAQFAERAALFVIRNDQAIGWRECEASDPTNLEMIGGVSLPLSADTLVGRAARSQQSWNGAPGSNSEDRLLIDQLGGSPQTVAAVPLVVRGKVVAVLYADSISSDTNALNVDALELLARVAAMAVNLASAPRAAPEKPAEPESVSPAPVSETAPAVEAAPVEPEPSYTPEVEPQPITWTPEPVAEEVSVEAEAERVPEKFAEAPVEEAPVTAEAGAFAEETRAPAVEEIPIKAEPEAVAEEPAAPERFMPAPFAPEPFTPAPTIEPAPETAPAVPSFASQYAAPLGSARRYGISEPELPIDVGEEERRLHNDARRFARLLVSEIKLYNEPKVREGRSRSDIYDRLREDIDRSRQMYDKRVAPPVAARHDYFHQELVNTLAEGDPAKLGEAYPGAILTTH